MIYPEEIYTGVTARMLTLKDWWLRFKSWLLLSGKRVGYCLFAITLLFTGAWCVVALQQVPFIIFGLALAFCSFYFLRLSSNIAEPVRQLCLQRTKGLSDQSIPIDLTTHYETFNIDGDYIQGNKNIFNNFNFDKDVFDAIDEIKQFLNQIGRQVGSIEAAQNKVINALPLLARQSSDIKNTLHEWLETLGFTSVTDEADAAKKIVEVAINLNSKYYKQFILPLDKRYRRLKYLLKTAQWREADEETVRVIQAWMPSSSPKQRCTNIIVKQIPIKQLRLINKLWLEASGGRFGFSVQKEIWLKIEKVYQYPDRFDLLKSEYDEYDMFAEAVGWSSGKKQIYHVEFDYLISKPRGYLPVKIMLLENYNSNSNYCSLSTCLFDDFMERPYSNVSFLPA